ncbi:MAG: response regulator [Planctomycetes bacterium]|nr:response regulator [Planctomycetota bacterium]
MNQNPPVILQADRRLGETRPFRTELRRRGARVTMAESPENALAIARACAPDVIVLDDDLGNGPSADLAEELQSAYPDAEMILLSSRPEHLNRGIGRGLLYHGLRPLAPSTLIELVSSALEGRLQTPPSAPESSPMILCVDDDRRMLDAVSRLLRRHGYRVSTFADPLRVLNSIPDIGPDLALIDVLMPDLDGRNLSRQIRDRYRGLFPIVMHSAHASDAERVAGFRSGADYFLPKPSEPHQILDVIDYYADRLDPEERTFLESRL